MRYFKGDIKDKFNYVFYFKVSRIIILLIIFLIAQKGSAKGSFFFKYFCLDFYAAFALYFFKFWNDSEWTVWVYKSEELENEYKDKDFEKNGHIENKVYEE